MDRNTRQMRRRLLVLLALPTVAAVVAATAFATTALTGIPDEQGVFHACVNNASGEVKLVAQDANCPTQWTGVSWSQTGPPGAQGLQGETGPQGPQGATVPPGPSDAFSTEASSFVTLPLAFTTILSRDVPAGSYVVNANVTVTNFSYPPRIRCQSTACWEVQPSPASPTARVSIPTILQPDKVLIRQRSR